MWALSEFVVGASLLAMNVNDNAVCLAIRGVFAFFASRLAPTGGVLEPDGVPEWIVTDMVD